MGSSFSAVYSVTMINGGLLDAVRDQQKISFRKDFKFNPPMFFLRIHVNPQYLENIINICLFTILFKAVIFNITNKK